MARGPSPEKIQVMRLFGEVVRDCRVERGLSQAKLADIAHVHRTYISQIETGENSPTVDVVLRLAHALEVLPSRLLRRFERDIALREKPH